MKDGGSEMSVMALLDVPSREIEAQLFFLAANLTDLRLQAGAAINVDINKASALRLPNDEEPGPNYGRLYGSDLKKIVKISGTSR